MGSICFAQQNRDSISYYYKLANHPQTPEDLPAAYLFFSEQKQFYEKKRDTLGLVANLRQTAIIQFNLGSYYDSESTAIEALKLLETYSKEQVANENRVGLYNQLGRVYRALQDYEVALDNYQKAAQIKSTPKNLNTIQNNIGIVYKEQGKFSLAEEKFEEILKNSEKISDSFQWARAMDNLGFVKSKRNKTGGLMLMNKALTVRIKLNDLQGVYASYRHFTEYYTDRNQKVTAKLYAEKALIVAQKINSITFTEDALNHLVELDENPIIIKYKKLKDSIETSRQIRDNKYALMRYNYFEQERLAKENEIQKERALRDKLFYQSIGFFILAAAISIYFILKAKNKKEKIQQVYNTETRISKKVHDEVANDIYHLMVKLQSKETNESLLDELEKIYSKTRDISKENAQIDIDEDFEENLIDLISCYRSEYTNIITRQLKDVNWQRISKIKKQIIYRVLQELMTNMKKHSKATLVVLSFKQSGKELSIQYVDNGIGCILKKGSGLQNTENRIKSANGMINFETKLGKGFKANLSI